MTGRDLITYILEHHLENSEVVKNGVPIGLLTIEEIAAKKEVGPGTVKAWIIQETIESYELKGGFYIPAIRR